MTSKAWMDRAGVAAARNGWASAHCRTVHRTATSLRTARVALASVRRRIVTDGATRDCSSEDGRAAWLRSGKRDGQPRLAQRRRYRNRRVQRVQRNRMRQCTQRRCMREEVAVTAFAPAVATVANIATRPAVMTGVHGVAALGDAVSMRRCVQADDPRHRRHQREQQHGEDRQPAGRAPILEVPDRHVANCLRFPGGGIAANRRAARHDPCAAGNRRPDLGTATAPEGCRLAALSRRARPA